VARREKKLEILKPPEEEFVDFSAPPEEPDDPFRALVRRCIESYRKINNDSLALDYNKVADKRLRAMVLADDEYQRETKSIYAEQCLAEMEELETLAGIAAGKGISGSDYRHPSERDGKSPIDKDMLTMRFKAAQARRDLRKEMAEVVGDVEKDSVYLTFVPVTREEFEKLPLIEISGGDTSDEGFDALIGTKEDLPEGLSGKLRTKGRDRDNDDEPAFDVLENGEIVER